jgi:hypothetical protein
MKKLIVILAAVLLLIASASAQSRLFLSLGGNLILPSDAGFKSIYGTQALYPELGVAIRAVAGLCLTGSFGQFSRTGATPDLGLESKASQSYISGGLGYLQRVSSAFCVEGRAGVAALKFSEEALQQRIEGSKMGFMAEGGLLFMPEEGQGFFLGLKLGFLSASVADVAPDIAGAQPVKLGGMKVALSVGIQLF